MCAKNRIIFFCSLLDILENVLLGIRENAEWPRFLPTLYVVVRGRNLHVDATRAIETTSASRVITKSFVLYVLYMRSVFLCVQTSNSVSEYTLSAESKSRSRYEVSHS